MTEPAKRDQPELRFNWRVAFICRDCGAKFETTEPKPSRELITDSEGAQGRMVLIFIPNACPDCKNIRRVK